jgi:osmotically-inducible protein OsmY
MKIQSVALAAGLAVALASGCAVTAGQQSVGQYVDDASITAAVKAKLAEDPAVSAARISVETMKGTVQLSGFATSASERQRAVDLARSVKGVTGVQDAMKVQAPTAKN